MNILDFIMLRREAFHYQNDKTNSTKEVDYDSVELYKNLKQDCAIKLKT